VRWYCTVFGETYSSAATSRLDNPCATSKVTASSCGPSGLYRGTARAILGHADAREEVVAAMHRSRGLGTRPYEIRAARRLPQWPFVAADEQ
jgi:hypothetical protein